jgi:AcrR family transcriptional regulator
MHYVTTSATEAGRRETRRRETEHRIHRCALVLTDERGLDGWTMDELAEAADVSRRTLFNYFPGKADAVLGATPELPADALAVFEGGGPTGRLVDDLTALAEAILTEKDFDPDLVGFGRRVLTETPRLLAIAHERFEQVMRELVDHLLRREGRGFGEVRARLLVRLLVVAFDDALDRVTEAPESGSVAELFEHNVRLARELLA